jgi:lipoate-protein ligase B
VEAFLLDRVPLAVCVELQRYLVEQSRHRSDGRIDLLLCEHPEIISVGRRGSPLDVATDSHLIRQQRIKVQWVNRGGGSLLHCPGQLAIYPIVPLLWHDFSVGEYLDRLLAGLAETLDELNIPSRIGSGRDGIWGRTGQLAAVGIAVRFGVTYFGVYLNVSPPMGLFRIVDSDPGGGTRMSCLTAERRSAARMTSVRATLVPRLAEALGCGRYHLHTGHPKLREMREGTSRL